MGIALVLAWRAVVKTERLVVYKMLILQCLASTKCSINVCYKYSQGSALGNLWRFELHVEGYIPPPPKYIKEIQRV